MLGFLRGVTPLLILKLVPIWLRVRLELEVALVFLSEKLSETIPFNLEPERLIGEIDPFSPR